MKLFIPITKVDAAQRLVYGTVAAEEVDKSNEIFDYATSKPFFEQWSGEFAKVTDGKSLGNVRVMHGNVAAGKLTALSFDDADKRIETCAKVVDDAEWAKVEEGVYTGFSMGGKYEKRWKDADTGHTRYTASPNEVSLVDNPCIGSATFSMIKADGSTELRKFKAQEEPAGDADTDLEQVWKAKDGTTHKRKSDAIKHNESLVAKAAAAPLAEATAALKDAIGSAEGKLGIEPAQDAAKAAKADATDSDNANVDGGGATGDEAGNDTTDSKSGKKKNKKSADKAARTETLRKGLYDVSRLACIISDLDWLQGGMESEAAYEGDSSPVPAELKSNIASLVATLKALVAEETAELFDDAESEEFAEILELAAKPLMAKSVDALKGHLSEKAAEMLAKAGARHNAADAKRVQAMHDTSVELGATCGGDADKSAHGGDLAKVAAERDALAKQITETTTTISDAIKRIQALEAQPAAAKGVVRVVEKGGRVEQSDEELLKTFSAMSPEEQTRLLTKAALRNPMPIGRTA